MDRSRIIAVLCEHADEIRARGVTRLALFGSAVRGEARPGSDFRRDRLVGGCPRNDGLVLERIFHVCAKMPGEE